MIDSAAHSFTSKRHAYWKDIPDSDWQSWKWHLQNKVISIADLKKILEFDGLFNLDLNDIEKTQKDFQFGITPYYFSLINPIDLNCPIRLQAIPSSSENVQLSNEFLDFPKEEQMMPVPGLTHRYPDRVMIYTTHHCAVYCRFCTRKRKVSNPDSALQKKQLEQAFFYIKNNPQIREIILSGGDIFSFSDQQIENILEQASAIPHIEIIRLGTRNLVTLPFRVTDNLVEVFKKFSPLYIHTHFNHPLECSNEALQACQKLKAAGCVVNNHTVLLKNVNDRQDIIQGLNLKLLSMGVQPYYIYHCDLTYGSGHFRTSIQNDRKLVQELNSKIDWLNDFHSSHYMVDTPGGGKIELI